MAMPAKEGEGMPVSFDGLCPRCKSNDRFDMNHDGRSVYCRRCSLAFIQAHGRQNSLNSQFRRLDLKEKRSVPRAQETFSEIENVYEDRQTERDALLADREKERAAYREIVGQVVTGRTNNAEQQRHQSKESAQEITAASRGNQDVAKEIAKEALGSMRELALFALKQQHGGVGDGDGAADGNAPVRMEDE